VVLVDYKYTIQLRKATRKAGKRFKQVVFIQMDRWNCCFLLNVVTPINFHSREMEFQIPKYSQGISKPGLRAKSFPSTCETRKYFQLPKPHLSVPNWFSELFSRHIPNYLQGIENVFTDSAKCKQFYKSKIRILFCFITEEQYCSYYKVQWEENNVVSVDHGKSIKWWFSGR